MRHRCENATIGRLGVPADQIGRRLEPPALDAATGVRFNACRAALRQPGDEFRIIWNWS